MKLSEKMQLFDPCGSADDPKTRQSVRRAGSTDTAASLTITP